VNRIGDTHTFTAHLEFDKGDGNGFVGAAGEKVDFAIASGPGTLSAASCTTAAAGTCTVDLVSSVTGTTEIDASWNGTVTTAQGTVHATAASDAEKHWVDALILINPPEATNGVGDDHVFTVTVRKIEQGVASPAAGVHVQTAITSGPGAFVGPDSCTTNAAGDCTVTINSTSTGLTKVEASATVTVNGRDVDVVTDGHGANAAPAVKRWVNARLVVSPSEATNAVGDTHTFTAHLELDLGDGNGFVDAPAGEIVRFSKESGPGTFVSDHCTTGAIGTCTVDLDSSVIGTTKVKAVWTGSVTTAEGSASMTRSDVVTKHWVAPGIKINKTASPVTGGPRTVTFKYVVTNIGDVELTNFEVTDDILGAIGTIDSLLPGESQTLTKDADVDENSPTTNVGKACGDPTVGGKVIGAVVCDTDPAQIAVVLGNEVTPPLPKTGVNVHRWLFFSGLLLALGAAGMNLELAAIRRRQSRA
jgi:hypothetical protein